MHIPKFLRVGRSNSRTSPSVASTNANRVSRSRSPPAEHVLSSHLSSGPGTSQQDYLMAAPPIDEVLDYSAGQTSDALHPVTSRAIPQYRHLLPTPGFHDSVAQSSTYSSQKMNPLSEHCDLSVVPRPQSQLPATSTVSQPLFLSPQLTDALHRSPSMVYGSQRINDSRNISIDGNMNSVTYTNSVFNGPNSFMEKLLEKTIPGAAFDSSARDPPPRCHPGTRLAILERCLDFVLNCHGNRKMRWVFGAAGVGKSAIMQSVAETPLTSMTLRASIFFVNGRSDGSKVVVTLAYQLAVECEPYRLFIERELCRDPSLLQKSMSVQSKKLIVDAFIHYPPLNSVSRVFIIVDGLDECDNRRTQEELLRLISNLCLTNPSSPLAWIITSRPEPHIISFFTRNDVIPAYEKEEIIVDSDEARQDVERFLRSELTKVQIEFSLNPGVQWPSEQDFWKLAQASGGLFVYAHTVTKYISDPDAGYPALQLDGVLKIIDARPLSSVLRAHPMAQLDALYAQILSKVPLEVQPNMRKLLLALVAGWEKQFKEDGRNFIVQCNWLGITCNEAYAAIRHLFSVLRVPRRDQAHDEELSYFHKSFIDYICDFTRSGFSPNVDHEAQQLKAQCTFRVLEEAPGSVDFGDVNYSVYGSLVIGSLARGTGTGSNITLTWPTDENMDWDDNKTRFYMYKMAIASVVEGIRDGQEVFYNVFCIRLLAMRFADYFYCGVENLHEVMFESACRQECIEQGLIKQVPVKALTFTDMRWYTWLRLHRPVTTLSNLPDPWNPSCIHEREGEWGEGIGQHWITEIDMGSCDFCCKRLQHHLEYWQARFPDHPILILFTSAGICFVEFRFIDQEGGVSEWTYWFVHQFDEEKRKSLGSTV